MSAPPPTRWTYGRDLKVFDRVVTWRADNDYGYHDVIAIDNPHKVPSKVLIASVAEQHPEGLPARDMYWIDPASGSRIGCTLFDNDWLEVVDDCAT